MPMNEKTVFGNLFKKGIHSWLEKWIFVETKKPYFWYTHKTSGFKTSGFKTSGLQNV
jgi:hypothetical protein